MSEPTMDPEFLMPSGPRLWQWLFTPFEYVAGAKALFLGLIAILFAGFVGSLSNTHLDGVLDLHTGRPAPLGVFLIEGIVDWLALALTLFALGKFISKTAFRPLDLFATQAMARWPMVLAALFALLPGYQRAVIGLLPMMQGGKPNIASGDLLPFAVTALVTVIAIIWMVALMYQSYRICCNVGGGSAVVTFVAGLLVAEAVSKVAIYLLLGSAPLSPGAPPQGAAPVAAPPALVAKANRYVELLATGQYEKARESWAPQTREAVPSRLLKAGWETMVRQYGPFQRRVGTRAEAQGESRIIYVACQFAKKPVDVRVVFDKSGRMAGVRFLAPAGLPHGAPPPAMAAATGPTARVASANQFVDLLAKGDYQTAAKDFDPTMQTALPPDQLQKAWRGLIGQAGAFQKRLDSRLGRERGFDVVSVTCQFKDKQVVVKVVFGAQQQISGLWFAPAQPGG